MTQITITQLVISMGITTTTITTIMEGVPKGITSLNSSYLQIKFHMIHLQDNKRSNSQGIITATPAIITSLKLAPSSQRTSPMKSSTS